MRVGIVGATGFVGAEMVRLLLQHPKVEVTIVTSRQAVGQRIDALYPTMRGQTGLVFTDFDIQTLANACDCAVLAVPSTEAMHVAPALLDAGLKVVDYCADFRLKDAAVYEQWYGTPHAAPHLLERAVYGLAERHRAELRDADLIAVAGCHPTGPVLAAAPLLEQRLIDPDSLSIVSLTSITGAGAKPTPENHYSAVVDTVRPYGLGGHRHIPEMEAELSAAAGRTVQITFSPQVIPLDRGILATTTARVHDGASLAQLHACLADTYADAPCVQVLPTGAVPQPHHVRGSNRCDIAVHVDERTGVALLFSVIDNLVKGAAGHAVQCLNLMCGWPEDIGLPLEGLGP